jgi:hypothetical protein
MLAATRTSLFLFGWFLLMHSVALATDLFRWTDANGVPHFTNDFYAMPESVRRSSNFTVRKNFFSSAASDRKQSIPEPFPVVQTQAAPEPDLVHEPAGPTIVTYAPQEVIVVVNSSAQQPATKSCVGDNCKRGFRPGFNHRWHIHSRGFASGSRPFTHP